MSKLPNNFFTFTFKWLLSSHSWWSVKQGTKSEAQLAKPPKFKKKMFLSLSNRR